MMKQNPLRLFRSAKKWTRADMARRTGVNYQTLDLIENGLIGKVTSKVMSKLLTFGVPEDLPRQYLEWKAVMQQYVPLEAEETKEGEVHVEDLEKPAPPSAVEGPPSTEEGTADKSDAEPAEDPIAQEAE